MAYIKREKRKDSDEVSVAELADVLDVYDDFCQIMSDSSDWNQDDILVFLKCNYQEFKKTIPEYLNNPESPEDGLSVIIKEGEEDTFLKIFRRLMIIDYVAQEAEYVHLDASGYKATIEELTSLSDDEFRKKVLGLYFLEVYSTNTERTVDRIKKEVLEALEENELLEKVKEVVEKE